MFLKLTVVKSEDMDKKETKFETHVRVRYPIKEVSFYQEYNAKDINAIVRLSNGTKFYVKESIEELDLIVDGANQKTTGLLYGKETT